MGHQRQDVERTKQYAKKFVRYKEGAEKPSLGLTKFQALAKEAKAVYKIDGIALVNCEIFERFLESFRVCLRVDIMNFRILRGRIARRLLTFCLTISIIYDVFGGSI